MKRVTVTMALLFTIAVAVVLAQYTAVISSATLPTCSATTPGIHIKTGTAAGLYVCQGGTWTGPMGVSSGTNTGDVTLAGVPTYLTLAAQVLTRNLIDLASHVTGDLPYANLTPSSNGSRLLGRGSASAGDWEEVTLGTNLSLSGTTLNATGGTSVTQPYPLTLTIDGGGTVLTAGMKGCTIAPLAGTIISATLLSTDAAVTSGSLVVDVAEDTLNNYPPTFPADSITASAKPTLSSATNSFNTTLTGWSPTLVNGDSAATISVVCYNVEATPASVTRAQLVLLVQP